MEAENGQWEERVARAREVLDFLENGRHAPLDGAATGAEDWQLKQRDIRLYRMEEITYEGKAPRREAMENILGTFRGIDGISFLYMILGVKRGVRFYLGIVRDSRDAKNSLDMEINDIGEKLLLRGIRGNFRGCRLEKVGEETQKQILDFLQHPTRAGILEGVPGVERSNRMEMQELDFQGTDRLIDVMSGEEFGYVVIARPYTDAETWEVERQLCEISDLLMPLAKATIQKSDGVQESDTETNVLSRGNQLSCTMTENETDTDQKTDSNTNTQTKNESSTRQNSVGITNNQQTSYGLTGNHNQNASYSETDSGSRESSSTRTEDSTSDSHSVSTMNSQMKQENDNYSHAYSVNDSDAKASSESHSVAKTHGKNETKNQTATDSRQEGRTKTESETTVSQMPIEQKAVLNWGKYLDEVLFPRLDNGKGKGLFLSATYLFVKGSRTNLYRLANTAISLFSGTKGNQSALRFTELDAEMDSWKKDVLRSLSRLQIPSVKVKQPLWESAVTTLSGRAETGERGTELFLADWLSSDELGLLTGFPQKEVIGLKLRKEVDFGLNVGEVAAEDRITLGHLVQCGEEKTEIHLDRRDLDKHMFVAGVTGSGKTTTCQKILLDCKLPFLVIEPVKSEYRKMRELCPDLICFTPGNPNGAPFFLNPFELFPGETISSRAAMIKATMEASFRMEAAIPQILETAIYRAYKEKGWDVDADTWNGKNEADPDGPFRVDSDAFPTFGDYAAAVKKEIREKGFDDRLRDEYMGTISAMTDSLLMGVKGQMLNTPKSVSFYDLVTKKAVIELDAIKSGSEKSLLMGFILTNLKAAVEWHHRENHAFRHITLVEEAHRLLSRYEPGDSLTQKQGVEVFADMLAEVRKYGESLIIVDQIPDKMTPEVLKNTNTKIVHKLFAQDDKEAIGNTISLDQDQKAFLSSLVPGRAIVFSQGWTKAVQAQVAPLEGMGENDLSDEDVRKMSLKFYSEKETIKSGVLADLALENPNEEAVELYFRLLRNKGMFIRFLETVREETEEAELEVQIRKAMDWCVPYRALGVDTIKRVWARSEAKEAKNEVVKEWIDAITEAVASGMQNQSVKAVYSLWALPKLAELLKGLNLGNKELCKLSVVCAKDLKKADRMISPERVYATFYDEKTVKARGCRAVDMVAELAKLLQILQSQDSIAEERWPEIKKEMPNLKGNCSSIRLLWNPDQNV